MEAFVYCWTDFQTNKLYVGVHKGAPDDGYVCSSKIMLQEHKKRPHEFSRQIIGRGTFDDCYALETAILKTVEAAKSPEFYNQHENNGKFHMAGKRHTEESKEKMKGCQNRLGKFGHKDSESTREKKRKMRLGKTYDVNTRQKIAEAKSMWWVVSTPNGTTERVKNLALYCRRNDLSRSHMVSRGKTKGFFCERMVTCGD
jgi:hypothetical protein